MLDKILDLAESLGKQIVHPKGQSVSATRKPTQSAPVSVQTVASQPQTTTTTAPAAKFLFYRIKPFKDNELGTGYWQGFLKSFSDITDPISFYISGNSHTLTLYAKIPVGIQFYFENVFYASFPTSELIPIDAIPLAPITNYIAYGEKDVIATDKDFKKDSDYLDPMKDLFSTYENVDQMNAITLEFKYGFKKKEDPWKKYIEMFKKILSFAAKKEEKKE